MQSYHKFGILRCYLWLFSEKKDNRKIQFFLKLTLFHIWNDSQISSHNSTISFQSYHFRHSSEQILNFFLHRSIFLFIHLHKHSDQFTGLTFAIKSFFLTLLLFSSSSSLAFEDFGRFPQVFSGRLKIDFWKNIGKQPRSGQFMESRLTSYTWSLDQFADGYFSSISFIHSPIHHLFTQYSCGLTTRPLPPILFSRA